ncbi:hypothetical protein GALL_209950 [mine drainage metagenome]|uniref:Uncharacterized protein n=1 Tax=mine drainage metagenome TaxID=410659 RepID=A0A1J5RY94_9ZZZZ
MRSKRVLHILRREMLGLKRDRIHVNLDLPDLAAVRRGNCGTRNRGELRADEVLTEVEQLLLRLLDARQRQLQDRHRGRVVVQDQRWRDAGRHLFQNRLRDRRDLGRRRAYVDVRLEENLDDAEAHQGLRFDMVDIVDGRAQCPLVVVNDTAGHVFRRKACICPDCADHRDLDVGEDIRRRFQCRQRADKQDQQSQHDKRVGAAQCNSDKPDHSYTPSEGNVEIGPARRAIATKCA